MNRHKLNTKVIIAVSNFLLQTGLQTLIKHIGVEPEYIIINSTQNNILQNYPDANYLIIEQDALNTNKSLKHLKNNFSEKVLLIRDKSLNSENKDCELLLNDSKELMVEKIQKFFTLQTTKQSVSGNQPLSTREIDVLKKVAKGLSNKEISGQLFISKNTVITHRKNITEKLGIKTISGLTVYALMNNLIDPGEITT